MDSNIDLLENEYDEVGVANKQLLNETSEEPKVRMTFSYEDEVQSYNMMYVKQKGVGVHRTNSKQGEDGSVRWFTLVCARPSTSNGKAANVLKPRQTEKLGCMARINATLNDEGGYSLTSVNLEHTHICSTGKARHFKCFKNVDACVTKRFEINDEARIRTVKYFKSLLVEAGGYKNVPFEEKEYRNYINKAQKLCLGVGGVETLLNYF
ncbi:uncharacterized protein LOC122306279 [Carya illinoinensis]|uniref:uncharacterized protein LOC122306279 n=1 Tax=Carya illinoinensis TaxID=32201 RepID=UPI001C72194B|nr:uncharacterized protein LOC122306279 [Carya illinoinensis]